VRLKVYRSILFVPVNNPRFVERAWTRNTDAIILDLEDSVPMAEKERARQLVREAIPKVAKGGASVFLRINKDFVRADLTAAIWPGISRIILPKTESACEVRVVAGLLTELERKRGIPVGNIEITPLLESALGVVNILDIVRASPRIKAMRGGAGYDMAVDLGIEMFASFDQYAYSEAMPTLAEMMTGVEATGAVFVPNPTGKANQSETAVALAEALRNNFIHEATILHPALVAPLVAGLAPKPEEVAWAKKVVAIFEEMEQDGENRTEVEGRVVDIYEYRHAQELIEWTSACSARDRYKEHAVARARSTEKTEKAD
jgi:citrate lyase subunit beta/citryl-CoA lyase